MRKLLQDITVVNQIPDFVLKFQIDTTSGTPFRPYELTAAMEPPPSPGPAQGSNGRSRSFIAKRAAGFLLVIGALFGALLFPFPLDSRESGALFDLAHAPSFLLVFLLIAGLLDPSCVGLFGHATAVRRMTSVRLILLATGIEILGIIGELAQAFVDRSPSLSDVAANSAGLLSGYGICLGIRAKHPRKVFCFGVSAVLLLLATLSPALELHECVLQRREFPVLFSFERDRELNAWVPHAATIEPTLEWAVAGKRSLKITAAKGRGFPGANCLSAPQDWSGYGQLVVTFFQSQPADLQVTISVSDSEHPKSGFNPRDRFERNVTVPPSRATTATIDLRDVAEGPENRRMDLTRVRSVNIFVKSVPPGTTFLIDNLRLDVFSEAAFVPAEHGSP